jgi:PLP dependent protein
MNFAELPERIARVREEIAAAAARSGRGDGGDVTLVAVTKTHGPEAVRAVLAAGLLDAGENRVQELERKVEAIGRDAVRWHLLGPLQRNKVKRAIHHFDLLHALDSQRVAEKISAESVAAGLRTRALVQVNTSGEGSKSGFSPEEVTEAVGEMSGLPGLQLVGVMTMAPYTDDQKVIRATFAAARRIYDDLPRQVPGFRAEHLSMGMSNDYAIAVEEGSTTVRLGTALLGEREE